MQGEEEQSEEVLEKKKTSDKDIKNMKSKFDELFNNQEIVCGSHYQQYFF